ncbi:Uncharacterised protein [Mycobacteroides abscessus subsp. abscessus]|nr:Uncharacterised protein [Mycobacteroides abscessus subsp. abscessus]
MDAVGQAGLDELHDLGVQGFVALFERGEAVHDQKHVAEAVVRVGPFVGAESAGPVVADGEALVSALGGGLECPAAGVVKAGDGFHDAAHAVGIGGGDHADVRQA